MLFRSSPVYIKLGGDSMVIVTYHGLISLVQTGGRELDALYTLAFRFLLLSISRLDLAGYTTTIKDGICTMFSPTITGHRIGHLYIIGSAASAYKCAHQRWIYYLVVPHVASSVCGKLCPQTRFPSPGFAHLVSYLVSHLTPSVRTHHRSDLPPSP